MMDLGSSPFTVSDRAQLGPSLISVDISALEPQRLPPWVRLVCRVTVWLRRLEAWARASRFLGSR